MTTTSEINHSFRHDQIDYVLSTTHAASSYGIPVVHRADTGEPDDGFVIERHSDSAGVDRRWVYTVEGLYVCDVECD